MTIPLDAIESSVDGARDRSLHPPGQYPDPPAFRPSSSPWLQMVPTLIALLAGIGLLVASATAQTLPSADGLVGYWDFQSEDVGLDSSPWNRHGIAYGTPTRVLGPGVDEKALSLDGASHLEIPNLGEDLNQLQELTLMAWIRVAGHEQKNVFRSQQPVSFASDRIQVRNTVDGSGWHTLVANPAPPTDTWYHLAATFDHGTLKLYLDGQLHNSTVLPFTETAGVSYPSWAIGARVPGGSSGADQFFTGDIDELRIFLTALGPEEIGQMANRAPTAVADTLAASAGICSSLEVVANDTDPDGDVVFLVADAIEVPPEQGTATAITEGRIRYCADANAAGSDTFRYRITDGRGGFSQAWVQVDLGLQPQSGGLYDREVVWKDEANSQALFIPLDLLAEHAEDLSALPLSVEDQESLQYHLALGRRPVGPGGLLVRCFEPLGGSRLASSPQATDYEGLLDHREVGLAGTVIGTVPGWDSRTSQAARMVWVEVDKVYQDPDGRFREGAVVAYLQPFASFEVAGAELCTEAPELLDAALPSDRVLLFADGRDADPRFVDAALTFPITEGQIEPQGYGLLAAWQSEALSTFENGAASLEEASDVQ